MKDEKIAKINAYALPTIGHFSAFVDVDIDKHAKRFGNTPHKLKVNIFSPEKLDEGETVRIVSELQRQWERYIADRKWAQSFYKWWKLAAIVEILVLSGIIINDFSPPFNYLRLIWDIFFWGLILGFTCIIPGIRSLRTKRRENRAQALLKNWKDTEFSMAEDQKEIVISLRDFWKSLKGRETETKELPPKGFKKLKNFLLKRKIEFPKGEGRYDKMVRFSQKIGFEPGVDFYKWKIKDLIEEESFYTEHLPGSFRRKLKNYFFGVKVESPKIVAPVRNMDISPQTRSLRSLEFGDPDRGD